MEPSGDKHVCDEQLTVHYADGSTDVLTADTWSQYYKDLPKGQNTDLRQTDGIPVFQFNHFDPSFLKETNDAAAQMSNAEISMLDLRSNVGGLRGSCASVVQPIQPPTGIWHWSSLFRSSSFSCRFTFHLKNAPRKQ